MFAFAFDQPLFEFEQPSPQFEPLFELPLTIHSFLSLCLPRRTVHGDFLFLYFGSPS